MTTVTRAAVAILAAATLAVPAAAAAKGGPEHGHPHAPGAGAHPGEGREHDARTPALAYVFKGTVVSVDTAAGTAAIKVAKLNHRRRSARNVTVTFDLTAASVAVADVNADGAATVADVAAGDRVLVQARLARRSSDLTGIVVARRLVDRTHRTRTADDAAPAPADD